MVSDGWAWPLTVVFAVTGVYSLVRWLRIVTHHVRSGLDARLVSRTVEVDHVLMSAAMVIMVWWSSPVLALVETVVFTGFGVIFLGRLVRQRATVLRLTAAAHLVTNAAMVWMLLPMVGGHDQMSLHRSSSSVVVLVVTVLVAVATWWVTRAVLQRRDRVHCCCHSAMGLAMAIMAAVLR